VNTYENYYRAKEKVDWNYTGATVWVNGILKMMDGKVLDEEWYWRKIRIVAGNIPKYKMRGIVHFRYK